MNEADRIREKRESLFADDPKNSAKVPLLLEEFKARAKNMALEVYEMGRILTETKEIVERGYFKKPIEKEFGISYAAANNFMRVYRYCLGRPQITLTIKSSVLYQIASPKFPTDLREYLFENADFLKEIDNKTVKAIYKKFKTQEIDLNSKEVKALVRYHEDEDQYSQYIKEIQGSVEKVKGIKDIIRRELKGFINRLIIE